MLLLATAATVRYRCRSFALHVNPTLHSAIYVHTHLASLHTVMYPSFDPSGRFTATL